MLSGAGSGARGSGVSGGPPVSRPGRDVHGRERLADRLKDRPRPGREAAHRLLGSPLHEQQYRVLLDGGLDLLAQRVGRLVAHAMLSVVEALVWMDSAWMRPPISAPNTS